MRGYAFPVGWDVQLSINGVAIGGPIRVDSDGQFESMISTSAVSAEGYYVLSASSTLPTGRARPAQGGTVGMDRESYRLASDEPLRVPPVNAPAGVVAVPAAIPALTNPPVVYLPMIRR